MDRRNDSPRHDVAVSGDTDDLDEFVPVRYSITSYGADYPVDSLMDRLESGAIYIPPFQRGYVWSLKQASRFIESLLLGLPVPGIFLARESDTQRLIVVDGQQRLKTLQFFYDGIFPRGRKEFSLDLDSPGVSSPLTGLTYASLTEDDRRHLDDSIIHATIIRQDEPSDGQSSVYSIFERLNTGGVRLEPQEIRAVLFHGPLSDLLRKLNAHPDWRAVFGPTSPRMRDQELILRFFALYFERHTYSRPMKEFLNSYMDRNQELRLQTAEELTSLFVPTISMVAAHIGRNAFKPKRAINAAVFDAVMIGVAHRIESGPIVNPDQLKPQHERLLSDPEFVAATTRATADEQSVMFRIDEAVSAFADIT